MKSGLQLLVDGCHGIYVPKVFTEMYDLSEWNISSDYVRELSNIDNDIYWDVWECILDNAYFRDEDNHVWRLHQDGDLFAVCYELISAGDYYNFFGEYKND